MEPPGLALDSRMRLLRSLLVLSAAVLMTACGGGGSSSSSNSGPSAPAVSMSLSSKQLSPQAAYSDPAPAGQITITLSKAPSSTVYVWFKSAKGLVTGATIDPNGSTATSAVLDLQYAAPSSLGVGTFTDTCTISVTFDQAGQQQLGNSPQDVAISYTVTSNPAPTLTALGTTSVMAGSPGFTLSLTGTGFNANSVIQWNGSPLTTSFLSSTQVSATVPSADLSSPGSIPVTVSNAASNGGVSAPLTFTIQPQVFSIVSISPSYVSEGGPAFTLTVNGALFDATAVVQWNGAALPTTFISSMQLTATVPAADVATAGSASITVLNPAAQGGTSNAAVLTITHPEAVAFQINPAHTGSIQFGSVTLPASSAWSVTLDGPPSYPLIAQGKVFVTVPVSGGGSELLALDETTGNKVWGPILIGGTGNAVYDSGNLFVLYTSGGANGGILQAFDGATGASKWSTTLPNQYMLDSAPTAANGTVYATESGSGVTLYAYDEATGNLKWSDLLAAGDNCAPAVTATGVYVSYPQIAAAFDPVSGSQLWLDAPGGDGGGGAIPVVANGVMYAPNGSGTYNGQILNAASGALLGSYIADKPPAIGSTTGYFLQGGTLRGISLSNNTVLWSFAGDGSLVTCPILVNNVVFVGSSSGNLYALDGTTGATLWTQALGAAIPSGPGWGGGIPLRAIGAGEGLLVVPAGNTLTAFKLN